MFLSSDMIRTDWKTILADEFKQPYFSSLDQFLASEYQTQTIYPPKETIFQAFNLTPYDNVKVVILGQDPYHGPKQAQGLSFSVSNDVAIPPSLKNIFKELHDDLNAPIPHQGDLSLWAQQGVLLLNTVLTVRKGEANSHRQKGWERLTDVAIQALNDHPHPIAFVLWGKPAQSKKELITNDKHLILEAPHPSPLSSYRGFFGSKPFSTINHWLLSQNRKPINWELSADDSIQTISLF